jgi:hypothetical protein
MLVQLKRFFSAVFAAIADARMRQAEHIIRNQRWIS